MAKPSTQSRLTHLLKHWPSDPVRPASVSVQSYLLSQSQSKSQSKAQPQISESSVNALNSLLEGRYARRYPLPPKLRWPASNPDHYDNVVREFEEAPNRNWWGRLSKRLRGLLRFK